MGGPAAPENCLCRSREEFRGVAGALGGHTELAQVGVGLAAVTRRHLAQLAQVGIRHVVCQQSAQRAAPLPVLWKREVEACNGTQGQQAASVMAWTNPVSC